MLKLGENSAKFKGHPYTQQLKGNNIFAFIYCVCVCMMYYSVCVQIKG